MSPKTAKSSYKTKVLKTLDKADSTRSVSRYFDLFIITLIALNVLVVIVETVNSIYNQFSEAFYYFELFSVAIFTVEYFIRLWACTSIPRYAHPIRGRLSYIFSLPALIDLLAIVPFYLPLLLAVDGRILRILRLFRLMRIFKLGRYSVAFQLVMRVLKKRKDELMVSLTLLIVMLILASTLMFYIENSAQPEVFTSIPATMWWAVATLTTVGYGDVYPITALGKLLGAFIAVMGIGLFALPAGIIAAGFESEYSLHKKGRKPENGQAK